MNLERIGWILQKKISQDRIHYAQNSLKKLLFIKNLKNKTFFDIGCGSGLSCLVAAKMGAKIFAIDNDEKSVLATKNVLNRYASKNSWEIKHESILNKKFISNLEKFDIVHSWGTLHHTGDMWNAIDIASKKVKKNGLLAISIYNDQGGASKRWYFVKKIYVCSPWIIKFMLICTFFIFFETRNLLIKLIRFQNIFPFKDWKNKKKTRGMSVMHDLVDWVGGFPFEYAKPEEVFLFIHKRGFQLKNLTTCAGGHGCNEFLFKKI